MKKKLEELEPGDIVMIETNKDFPPTEFWLLMVREIRTNKDGQDYLVGTVKWNSSGLACPIYFAREVVENGLHYIGHWDFSERKVVPDAQETH